MVGVQDCPNYLGSTCSKVETDGISDWAFSLSQCKKAACDSNDQLYFLPNRANAPFQNDYQPEIDVSDELSPEFASYYQLSIGILRRMVELGRVDITAEVSMMSWCFGASS